jgi:hypothetical protein
LLDETPQLNTHIDGDDAVQVYQELLRASEAHSRAAFEQLLQKHTVFIDTERQKTRFSFQARRRAVERLGLPEVRNYRLKQLAFEEEERYRQIEQMAEVHPILDPLLMLRIN